MKPLRRSLFLFIALITALCVGRAQIEECPSDTGWVPIPYLQPPAQVCAPSYDGLIDALLGSLVTHDCQFCDLYETCPQQVYFNPALTQESTFAKPTYVPGMGWCSHWTGIDPDAAYRSVCSSCPE